MKMITHLMRAFALLSMTLIVSMSFAGISFAADLWQPYGSIKDTPEVKYNWTGVYIGGNVGYQVGDTELSSAVPDHNLAIDGTSSDGWKYGIRGGFDWQVSDSPFVIGVFAGYDWGDQDFEVNYNGTNAIGYSIEPTWHVGARAGLVVTPGTLVYVGYAYGEADLDVSGFIAADGLCNTNVNCSDTLEGHTFLAGAELRITENFSTAMEYNYTAYDTHTFYSGRDLNVKADPDVHAVMLRLNWRPNFGGLF